MCYINIDFVYYIDIIYNIKILYTPYNRCNAFLICLNFVHPIVVQDTSKGIGTCLANGHWCWLSWAVEVNLKYSRIQEKNLHDTHVNHLVRRIETAGHMDYNIQVCYGLCVWF